MRQQRQRRAWHSPLPSRTLQQTRLPGPQVQPCKDLLTELRLITQLNSRFRDQGSDCSRDPLATCLVTAGWVQSVIMCLRVWPG